MRFEGTIILITPWVELRDFVMRFEGSKKIISRCVRLPLWRFKYSSWLGKLLIFGALLSCPACYRKAEDILQG